MTEVILTLNTGSSSVKIAAYEVGGQGLIEDALFREQVNTAAEELNGAVVELARRARQFKVAAVSHRIVHGGRRYNHPVILNEAVIADLRELAPLAPQHQPANLAGVAAAQAQWPDTVQIGCFDTAFHRTMPKEAQLFGLPMEYFDKGILRYGFHGLSYDYIAGVLPKILDEKKWSRVIVAHLGAGASMCALFEGRSIATTMGFSALDGLPMAARCGSIDPGVLLHFLTQKGFSATDLEALLYKQSGLLGLSGLTGDMKTLEASDDENARAAIEYFTYRASVETGGLASALGGIDALVFTGGVGENSALIRHRILKRCIWLGFELDERANAAGSPRITSRSSPCAAYVIPTDEELVLARGAIKLL